MTHTPLILIAHNLRSAHNVGSILRTADGFGVQKVFLSGYTPYPKLKDDSRLPHLADKIDRAIAKTALGAEKLVPIEHNEDIFKIIEALRGQKYTIAALEQTPGSLALPNYQAGGPLCLIVGREVEGLEPEVLEACDLILEIPMLGKKESLNVASATAVALYHLRFLIPLMDSPPAPKVKYKVKNDQNKKSPHHYPSS